MLIQCSTQDERSSSKLNQAVAGADADAAVPKEQPDSSESNSPHQPTPIPAQETPLGSEKQDVPEEPKVQLSKEMEGAVDSSMFYYFQIIWERDLIKR